MTGDRHASAPDISTPQLGTADALPAVATVLLIAGIVCFSAVVLAQTSYRSLTPGSSRRADVERTLGYPVGQVTGTVLTYPNQAGTGPIQVEYNSDWLVQSVELRFLQPIERAPVVQRLIPGGQSEGKLVSADGRMKEHFGAPNFAVLSFAGKTETDGVIAIGFYSRDSYARLNSARKGPINVVPASLGALTAPSTSSFAPALPVTRPDTPARVNMAPAPALDSGSGDDTAVARTAEPTAPQATPTQPPPKKAGWQQFGQVLGVMLGGIAQSQQPASGGTTSTATPQRPASGGTASPTAPPSPPPASPSERALAKPGATSSTGVVSPATAPVEVCDRFQGKWTVDVRDPQSPAEFQRQQWIIGARNVAGCSMSIVRLEPYGSSLDYQLKVAYTTGSPLRFSWTSQSVPNQKPEQDRNQFNGVGQVNDRAFALKGKTAEGHVVQYSGARQ